MQYGNHFCCPFRHTRFSSILLEPTCKERHLRVLFSFSCSLSFSSTSLFSLKIYWKMLHNSRSNSRNIGSKRVTIQVLRGSSLGDIFYTKLSRVFKMGIRAVGFHNRSTGRELGYTFSLAMVQTKCVYRPSQKQENHYLWPSLERKSCALHMSFHQPMKLSLLFVSDLICTCLTIECAAVMVQLQRNERRDRH